MITCYFENKNKVGLRHMTVNSIVVKDGKVLLEKRGTYSGKPVLETGKWSLLGGFMDRDETLMEAAKREVMEESGWRIKNLKLFAIIDEPNRPNDNDRQNVGMFFLAKAVSQIPTVNEEVSELKWFDVSNLPPKDEFAFDFYDILELYKKYLKKRFTLPVLKQSR